MFVSMNELWKAQLIRKITLSENAEPTIINATVREEFKHIAEWTSENNFRLLQCQPSFKTKSLHLDIMDGLGWSQLLA
jgi:hypothetical protein